MENVALKTERETYKNMGVLNDLGKDIDSISLGTRPKFPEFLSDDHLEPGDLVSTDPATGRIRKYKANDS